MPAIKRARRRFASFDNALNRLALLDTHDADTGNDGHDSKSGGGVTAENPQCGGGIDEMTTDSEAAVASSPLGESIDSADSLASNNIRKSYNSLTPSPGNQDSQTRNAFHASAGPAPAPASAATAASHAANHFSALQEHHSAAATMTPRMVSFENGGGLMTSSRNSSASASAASSSSCCVVDVTSSFLSMSPCSELAGGVAGWSPVSVAAQTFNTHQEEGGSDKNSDTTSKEGGSICYNASGIHASWRDSNNNKNKRSVSSSDGPTTCSGLGGKFRSNRKRALHRLPPSKCLSSLAAEVSILDDDNEEDDNDEVDYDCNSSLANTTFSSSYDGRSSFNTRPYKRQPSSGEWGCQQQQQQRQQDYSLGYCGGGSASPCLSLASSTGSSSASGGGVSVNSSSSLNNVGLLSRSAPCKTDEWGQFVDVIPDEQQQQQQHNKARPQPLIFSPGLGLGRGGCGSSSGSITNLPYFPKSRRRSSHSSSRRPMRRRASSVGSQESSRSTGTGAIASKATSGGSSRRRFALNPRHSRAAADATTSTAMCDSATRSTTNALFSGSKSIRFKDQYYRQPQMPPLGPIPPPPSPSLGQLAGSGTFSFEESSPHHRQGSNTDQPPSPRSSLDNVASALDQMQV